MSSEMIIRRTLRHILLGSACLLTPTLPAAAHDQQDHATPSGTAVNYGRVHFPVSCSPQAQQQFDQAAAMMHSFHFPATGQAFGIFVLAIPGSVRKRRTSLPAALRVGLPGAKTSRG